MFNNIMSNRFDKPFLFKNQNDSLKIGTLFNYALNFDLEGLRRESLTNKIPLNIVNENNENLIHVITRTESEVLEDKRLKIIKFLVSKGVNPDLPNDQEITPLHYACENQYENIIEYLLECGCNPNTKDNFGRTPLHYLLSGLIVEWKNKENKPLFYKKRNKLPEDIFNLKVQLKKKINDKLKEKNFERILLEFVKKMNPEIFDLEDIKKNIFDDLDLSSNLTTEDLQEKLKTRNKTIIDKLDNVLNLTISNLYNKETLDPITTEEHISSEIKKNKEEILESIDNKIKIIKGNQNFCIKNKKVDQNNFIRFDNRGIRRLVDSEEYLEDSKISPFYPLYINLGEKNYFISNSETETIYTKYPNLEDLKNRLTNNPLSLYYYFYAQSFTNDVNLVPEFDIPEIKSGEDLESIIIKLYDNDFFDGTVVSNQVKLEKIIFVGIILFLYNPEELKDINDLLTIPFLNYDNTIADINQDFFYFILGKMQELIKSDEFENFIFELFYSLIETGTINGNPININGDNYDRIYSLSLYLFRMLKEKDIIINFTKIDEIINYVNNLTKYEMDLDNLPEDNEDKKFMKMNYTKENLAKELLSLPDNPLVIEEDRFKNDETYDGGEHNKIYSNKQMKLFFPKLFEWISPSLRKVFGYHYLIKELNLVDLNQAIFTSIILNTDYLGETFDVVLHPNVNTIRPDYQDIPAGNPVEEKKYLIGYNLIYLLKNNLCELQLKFLNILSSGDYPLLKIFNLDSEDAFDKYFNRVVPYHLRSLMYLENSINENVDFLSRFNTDFGNLLQLKPDNYYNFVNKISLLNYLKTRFANKDSTIEIPNFYYYPISKEIKVPRMLSYGTTEPAIDFVEPDEIILPIKNNKLRISRSDLPESIKTKLGYNYLLNYFIIKNLPLGNDEIKKLVEDFIKNLGINIDVENLKIQLLEKIFSELTKEILKKISKIKSLEILKTIDLDTRLSRLIPTISSDYDKDISYQSSTDFEIDIVTEPPKGMSIFPIIKENSEKIETIELYFSNDYIVDEYNEKLYEIKFNDNCLIKLLNNGANPFLTDNMEQSAIHILSTNYLIKPLNILKEIGVDLRQPDENGFNFIKKIDLEKEYHKSFINLSKNNFREIIKPLIKPFYKSLELKINYSITSGFNHLRYSRLALELTVYYNLVNKVDLIKELPSKLYPNDIVLAKHLLNNDEFTKTKEIIYTPSSENLVENHLNFLDTFYQSPGVFLDEFENIIKNKKLLENYEDIKITKDFAINYFIENKTLENKNVKESYKVYQLVCNQVIVTQIIYILTNLINAHLRVKYATVDSKDSVRIIEEILENPILERSKPQNLLDIIKNETLPKLMKNILNIYIDDIDKDETIDYGVNEFTNEIVVLLKLIPKWFNEDDKLLTEIIPEFLNSYLEIYLPTIISSMKYITENIYKWIINYNKLKELSL